MDDPLDQGIINYLKEDARITNKEMAEALHVSEGTIRNRINRLKEQGILKIVGLVDPFKYSKDIIALIGVKLSTHELMKTAQEFSKLKGVLSVSIVTGRYDLICEVMLDLENGLINFLTDEVSKIKNIQSTETFIVVKSFNKWIQPP